MPSLKTSKFSYILVMDKNDEEWGGKTMNIKILS